MDSYCVWGGYADVKKPKQLCIKQIAIKIATSPIDRLDCGLAWSSVDPYANFFSEYQNDNRKCELPFLGDVNRQRDPHFCNV